MGQNNEKLENMFNLALDATEGERSRSISLDVGYDRTERAWEVIAKIFGTAEELRQDIRQQFRKEAEKIGITDLSNQYVIMTLPETLVKKMAELERIEYIEKPKRLFFATENGRRSSCIEAVQQNRDRNGLALTGRGVIVAVIDSGIDYAHPDFRKEDGTTRILLLWDQELGEVFDSETINRALEEPDGPLRDQICPSRDLSGHGTVVAGIAAGNGRASEGRYRGVAVESELIVVKLGAQKENSFPRTTELMRAVDFCVMEAARRKRPVVLNISFGNNYGSHSGTSLLETYLDDMSDFWKTEIVVGSGNEGNTAMHTAGILKQGKQEEVEIAVSDYENAMNLQIWKNYVDEIQIAVVHPNGRSTGTLQERAGAQRFTVGNTELLIYYGEPSPYNRYQEIYMDFIPSENYIDSGIWKIRILPQKIVAGKYNMWLPSGGVLNTATGFLRPVEETTLTIPSTASKVLTVGAYDARYEKAAAFSGRGYTRVTDQIKPDLVAPGVEITSCAPGGGYQTRSGTSMAAPFVSGSAALLMQWGIVDGNDPYLYGEKIKAYLIRGAKQLPAGGEFPNPVWGWGALCVERSLPSKDVL